MTKDNRGQRERQKCKFHLILAAIIHSIFLVKETNEYCDHGCRSWSCQIEEDKVFYYGIGCNGDEIPCGYKVDLQARVSLP